MSPAKKTSNRAIDEQIGKNIRALRAARGMSQERLGEMVGVTFQQIQKYEKGSNRVAGSMLFRITQVFDIPVGTLFADIPGAASETEQSGFDRLATRAEVDRLRDNIATASAILARGAGGSSHGQLPAVHSSR